MKLLCAFLIVCLSILPASAKYSGGTGEPNDPYQIVTAADLIALGETPEDYDKHFILTADIDLDPNLPGRKIFDGAIIAPDIDLQEWGFQGTSFTGVFDGAGRVLSHLTIVGKSFLGVFGHADVDAEIRDLCMMDVDITGPGGDAGALVGQNAGAVARCSSRGVVRGALRPYIGGLAGSNSGRLTDCHSDGLVQGMDHVGGLVGWNGGSVIECSSTAQVNGIQVTGGVVGANAGTVIRCHSAGAVRDDSCVGGLVGYNGGGSVAQCYNSGPVSGASSVGGLVGRNGAGSVTQCFSSALVSGVSRIGGLVGDNSQGALIACYWDIQTSGQTESAGGTGMTTAQMQTAQTFLDAGWDFVGETANGTEDVWWIFEGQDYPRLWWERVLGDDFEDGEAGPLWFVYEIDPNFVQIREVNGRLETTSLGQAQDVDAIYVADGWRLDTMKDFALRVDFHFSKQGGGDGRVNLGLTPSLDPEARQWAEMEAGCFESGPFYLYEVSDGFWVREEVGDRSGDDGTLYLSYNPDTDELYFSHTGYGKPNAWRTVTGLLKGRWAGQPVYVILSGGSEGLAFDGAEAWLDNFVVDCGIILN